MTRTLTLLAALALAAPGAPPAPESHFGHRMGQDRTTLEWAKVVSYFQKLDAESDRVLVREYGRSTEGRPMIAAFISAPQNLQRLEHYRGIQKKLADSRSTPQAEAEKLIAEGKAVVLITCSIHATEIASSPAAVEFAYRMATAASPRLRTILDNVILILAPTINPDGMDIVDKWYRRTLGTPHEGTQPPELYQKYVGHDNNRDWYIFSQSETRAVVSQLHNQWHPHIVYDVHQQGPTASRMFIPPFLDPIDPNVDPVIVQQINMLGMTMAADLTGSGRKGVAVSAIYDFWTPARHYQAYHGGLRILSESASVRIATPVNLRRDQISTQGLGYNPREQSWNYLEPWMGGDWKLRDIVDDQLICFESLLSTAAARREAFVRNFYNVLKRSVERASPYAFILPAKQADPGATKKLLETLDFGAVEIDRASAPFQVGAKNYEAGSYVVRLKQPFGSFAKTLLERQKYPDLRQYPGGPPKRPYDVTAHTLPLLLGAEADTAEDAFQAQLARTKDFGGFRGGLLPQGWLSAADSNAWRRVTAAWKAGRPVWRDPRNGNFYFASLPAPGAVELKKPRVALYRSHMPSMDEGWTRWILEDFGWEYTSAGNARLKAGNLRESFDAIVFAEQSAAAIHSGYRAGMMPDEFTGGVGEEGAAALKTFAAQGGKIVLLNDAAEYGVERLGVLAKNALQGVSNRDFYCPGSLLNVKFEPGHPLGFGLPAEFTVWFESSPVLEPAAASVKPLARFKDSGVLASGWLLGEKHLAGKPALLDAQTGQGHIFLFGMRPQYRAQSWLTLKLLFNALVW